MNDRKFDFELEVMNNNVEQVVTGPSEPKKLGRINRKICPKCFKKNTQTNSKLTWELYGKCMFCLECAIYYNKYVSEKSNE